jgi:hypothetical protein
MHDEPPEANDCPHGRKAAGGRREKEFSRSEPRDGISDATKLDESREGREDSDRDMWGHNDPRDAPTHERDKQGRGPQFSRRGP